MRIAMYLRLSPNPKKDDTVNQERELKEYISKQKDWELVGRYEDLNISGSKRGVDRPAFKKMMEDARNKKFDLLVFWALDRLSREGTLETITYLNQLASYGVQYRSYTEQYIDSCGAFRDVVLALLSTVAKQERVKLQERTLVGLQTARDRGVKLGRHKKVTDQLIMEEMREKGATLEEIADKMGVSYSTISRRLSTCKRREDENTKKALDLGKGSKEGER